MKVFLSSRCHLFILASALITSFFVGGCVTSEKEAAPATKESVRARVESAVKAGCEAVPALETVDELVKLFGGPGVIGVITKASKIICDKVEQKTATKSLSIRKGVPNDFGEYQGIPIIATPQ